MKKLFIILFVALTAIACTDAERSKYKALGSKHRIELIGCDGQIVKTWISTGKVSSEVNSDGYYFEDTSTGKIVEVTGTLIITQL